MITYTCDNCQKEFSDNEPGIVIQQDDDGNYCCHDCAIDAGVTV